MGNNNNEFLRHSPNNKGRGLVIDIAILLVPALMIIAGAFISAQIFAEGTGFNHKYCDVPLIVLHHAIGKLPRGYPIFNPLVIAITMMSHPFDAAVQAALPRAVPAAFTWGIAAIATWVLLSVLRTAIAESKNKLYGTSRWMYDKELAKHGLNEKQGVVLGQRASAKMKAVINKAGNSALAVKRTAPLICHQGTNHSLMIAPTRSGKGVGAIVPTCVSYPESMIIFDPKGELYNMTAGYRRKFSHVLKFSPVDFKTTCFNPLEEIELNENAMRDVGTVLTNIFQKNDKADSNADFFDNNARDLLTGVILHVLTAVKESGIDRETNQPIYKPLYKREDKCIGGVLRIFARAQTGEKEGGEEGDDPPPPGEVLIDEMLASKHCDENGNVSDNKRTREQWLPADKIHAVIIDVASSAKQQHGKVRGDIMQTVQSKLNLFRDPKVEHATSRSDFKISDFYETKEPISLYLTVPFGDIDRINTVFRLMVDFMLRKFASDEIRMGEKEKKLKHPILFLLDEFPVLGKMEFLHTSLGILAGYGLRFFIVCQAYQQLERIYGRENTFIDNCRYVVIYAPNKLPDAELFSKMIGEENVKNKSLSISGSRYSPTLPNINTSTQDVKRYLINPDELMKLPYTDCIILGHNMPAYMGKKGCFYADDRFNWKVYSGDPVTGKVSSGFPAPYEQKEMDAESAGLPSQKDRTKRLAQEAKEAKEAEEEAKAVQVEEMLQDANMEDTDFDPVKFLAGYNADEDGVCGEWDAPCVSPAEQGDGGPPPRIASVSADDFTSGGSVAA